MNISRQLISVPDCVNVGDGGLDALVENAEPLLDDVIPKGTSGFQIKSSDLTPSECKKELHLKKDINEPLKPGIKRVLDNDGVYIIVLFAELSDILIQRRKNAVLEDLKNNGYSNPKIRLYSASKIISFAERFPALLAKLKPHLFECIPYQIWSEDVNVSTPKTFIEDENRTKIIKEIRERLSDRDEKVIFIRITGLPGVGKKRLVYEALSPYDLKNTVIFVRSDAFRNSRLFNYILADNSLNVIIVIDNCSNRDHNNYYNRMGNKGSRLAVITISDESGDVPPPTMRHNLKPLSKEKLKELLNNEYPDLNTSLKSRFSEIAEGYPKIALLLVENYRSKAMETKDILSINDQDLFDELIAGNKLHRFSEDFRKIKKVLTGISLFKKVGYKEDLVTQAKWISAYFGVSWDDFQLIVKEQRERGIITGHYFITINPFLLEIFLVREWWESFARILSENDFNSFIESIPEEFRRDFYYNFISHFPFIGTTEPGKKLLNNMLSVTGIFSDGNLIKSNQGSDFFTKLGEASPDLALEILKKTIGTWKDTQLSEFVKGRNNILYFLKKLAYRAEYFEDAVKLILRLAESQPKDQFHHLNNANEAFAELFSPAWGELNTTVVPPKDRIYILKEVINSDSTIRKRIALLGFRRCLAWGHFYRDIGSEYLGDKPLPENWNPKTYGEIFDFYKEVWKYLLQQVENTDEIVRNGAIEILLNNARSLSGASIELNDLVRETILILFKKSCISRLKALRIVSSIIEFESKRYTPDIIKKWDDLKKNLLSEEFLDRLQMFLRMSKMDLEMIEKRFKDNNEIDIEIKKLTQEVIKKPELLEKEWTWLITENLYNIWEFGKYLGDSDQDLDLIDLIVENYEKISQNLDIRLLSGYFHSISQRDEEAFLGKIEALSKNSILKKFLPEIIMRSCRNDKSIKIIISLLQNDDIELEFIQSYKLSGIRANISEEIFITLLNLFLEKFPIEGSLLALTSVFFYFNVHGFRGVESKDLPLDFTFKLLNMPAFWEKSEECYARGKTYPNSRPEYWIETLKRFIEQYPEKSDSFLNKIIEFFNGKSFSDIIYLQEKNLRRALFVLSRMNPNNVWNTIKKYLLPIGDPRSSFLAFWLGGRFENVSPLTIFDHNDIWMWVEEDVEKRSPYLASFIPAKLFHSEEEVCLARELLIKYGDNEKVRKNFSSNVFNSGGVTIGPISKAYKSRKEILLKFSEDEENTNVKTWISEYISSYLEKDIKRAEIEEEKGNF
ncbi:hypothetical protein ES705_12961 [subsurface metagenome]